MEIKGLYKLKKSDIDRAAEVLGDSFEDDPLMLHILASETYNRRKMTDFYRVTLKSAFEIGHIYATSENLEGIVIWLPENITEVPTSAFVKNEAISLLWKIRLGVLKTLTDYENYAGEVHNRQIAKPHWYLFVIGIHSEHQKKGYASKLLKPFFDYFDKEGISCYLETHRESNTQIYQKFNFDLAEVGQVPKTNIKHFAMIRKPQSLQ